MYTVYESVGFWVVRDPNGHDVATCAAEWKAKGVARAMNGLPAVLDALKGFLHADPDVFRDELAAARRAIAKATGGE